MALQIKRSDLKRIIAVAKALQPIRIKPQKALRAEDAPLDNMDQFVEMQRLVFCLLGADEDGVQVGSARRAHPLEVREVLQPHCGKWGHWNPIDRHYL